MHVRVMVHDSGKAAADLLKEPADAAEGHGDATKSRPRLGDQAELVVTSQDLGEARVRISNLTIEVRYGGDFFDTDKLMDLVSEIVAAAEAEGR